jgi:hypothetical protein
MVSRQDIVEAARSYVGLPFSGPSRGFLIAVAERLNLPHRSASDLRRKFRSEHGIKPGDVVVLRLTATTAQNAIVTDRNGDLCLVRPDQRTGKIVEHILDQNFRNRILQVFELLEGLSDGNA